ncbi:MAG: hypothetical protein L0Y66_04075 [Myxococcaceae bacterium]|nr:hypothetical protein [Myxococcaceae bacterium]MCI0671300.1 hypothetical protein [Myxococcaceae bacterium]
MTHARRPTHASSPPARLLWAAGVLGWTLASCNLEGTCPPGVPLTDSDGGAFRCTRSEDCPRNAQQLVCTTDPPLDQGCVRCEDTRCVTAEPCE